MAQLAERPTDAVPRVRDRLLLVDADPNHREIFRRRLERRGYRVSAVASAEEATAALHRDRPGVVVMDPGAPECGRMDALEERLALTPGLPVILHSAYPPPENASSAWLADAYVQKSANLEPLLVALRRVLDGARGLTAGGTGQPAAVGCDADD